MTLVAIYYNPPTTNNSNSSNSSTFHSMNSSSKWKKTLAVLSSKYHNKRKHKCSPTTAAAATEKVLCHTPTTSIKCEDLTAKEFAQMAGIKIKSTSNSESEDESLMESSPPDSYLATCYKNEDESMLMMTQMTSISARTALSTKSCHQIWDSDFWQCNDTSTCKTKTKKTTTPSTITSSSSSTRTSTNDTLFISRLRSSTATTCSSLTVPGVIQKGRFKIVVGQDDCCEPVNQHHHVVLEWKRKRSDSSSNNVTKKK
jgi:hypothetical protein